MMTYRNTGGPTSVSAAGDVTTWLYDIGSGAMTNKVYADGSTIAYTHTSDGLLLRETKPSGAWKENVYDAARQIVGVVSSDGAQDASMQRDEFGRVMAESNSVALAEYSLDDCWDATNETQTVDGVSVSFERGFDAYGRIERFTRVGGEESIFDYAPHGAISTVSNGNVAVEYAFTGDALDAGYALAVQGGVDFSREVFRHGYLRSCIVAVSNHCGNASQWLEYSYDVLQRPVSRNADSFGYNVRGEVVFSRRDAENAEETYSYDDIGNLAFNTFGAITNIYFSNSRNQYTSNLCASASLREVNYDLDGNMTRHGEWTYAYDSGNRLVSVASNGITVVTMSYDTQGRRVKKVAADGTHRYFYDGWLLVYEHVVRTNNTTNEVEYVWGKDVSGTRNGAAGIGGLLYLKRDGAIYVPWYDAYGNILGYRDAQGNVVASYTYDAFGNIIGQSGAMSDAFAFRFSTKYFDADCGLYYYGYRHYKPQVMCWLTEDPIGEEGGLNLYCFCRNGFFKYDAIGLYVNLVYDVERKMLTATDVDTSETLTLKTKVVSGNGKSCCVKADQWKSDIGPLPVGKYLVGLSYVPKQHLNDTGDYHWYRLYGDNGKGGYTYNNIPIKTPKGTTVYRGGFNLHTGRASDGCVTVWSDVKRGEKGYPHSDDYDKLKKLLDNTKPLKYKNSYYTGWLEVK